MESDWGRIQMKEIAEKAKAKIGKIKGYCKNSIQ